MVLNEAAFLLVPCVMRVSLLSNIMKRLYDYIMVHKHLVMWVERHDTL